LRVESLISAANLPHGRLRTPISGASAAAFCWWPKPQGLGPWTALGCIVAVVVVVVVDADEEYAAGVLVEMQAAPMRALICSMSTTPVPSPGSCSVHQRGRRQNVAAAAVGGGGGGGWRVWWRLTTMPTPSTRKKGSGHLQTHQCTR